MTNVLRDTHLPLEIRSLLRALSRVGFFERSLLIGSWVMPIYQELYQARYVLRTLDIDFAVHVAHLRRNQQANLQEVITGLGFIDYVSPSGLQKFSSSGYEVEFITHRKGGTDNDVKPLKEWNITAQPLPFISILTEFSEEASLDDFVIRFPIPEAFFLHKLIIAPRRKTEAKRVKDLEQCTVLKDVINDFRLHQVIRSQRLSKGTWRHIRASGETINFPLQRLVTCCSVAENEKK